MPVHLPEVPFVASGADCPYRRMFEHLTSKWGVLVLVALEPGTLRWAELKRRIEGVTEKMLAQTLRTLEADGLVLREALPVVPPPVEDSLTSAGREAVQRRTPLLAWLHEYVDAADSRRPGS